MRWTSCDIAIISIISVAKNSDMIFQLYPRELRGLLFFLPAQRALEKKKNEPIYMFFYRQFAQQKCHFRSSSVVFLILLFLFLFFVSRQESVS